MPSAASNRHSGNGRVKRPQWPMAHPVPPPVVVCSLSFASQNCTTTTTMYILWWFTGCFPLFQYQSMTQCQRGGVCQCHTTLYFGISHTTSSNLSFPPSPPPPSQLLVSIHRESLLYKKVVVVWPLLSPKNCFKFFTLNKVLFLKLTTNLIW